jgi:type III pantothenate kinase
MILAIDVGNTNILFSVIDKDPKPVLSYRTTTDIRKTPDQYYNEILSFINAKKSNININNIKCAAVSSVVPSLNHIIKRCIEDFFNIKFILIDRSMIPIKILTENPSEVGIDRIIDSFSASLLYEKQDLIVVDFGTATTINVITQDMEYIGGAIFPGIEMIFSSLSTGTAKISQCCATDEFTNIGKTTAQAITSGIVNAYNGLLTNFIHHAKHDLKSQNPLIIVTGGSLHSKICQMSLQNINYIAEPDLTIQGICKIAQLINNV